MGIDAISLAWIDRLHERGAFHGMKSVFDLGPQDLFFSPRMMEALLRRRSRSVHPELLEAIFTPSPDSTRRQEAFYRAFGFEMYASCDALDMRAQHKLDLNRPVRLPATFDCVTNFGTAEHVYSVGQVFESAHQLLAPGGVALHALPAFGDVNHGFYNIHPCLYFELGRANDYEVVDYLYVDNMHVRRLRQEVCPEADQLAGLAGRYGPRMPQIALSRELSRQYASNVLSEETQIYLAGDPGGHVVDYCFAALRKASGDDRPFVFPFQHADAVWAEPLRRCPLVTP